MRALVVLTLTVAVLVAGCASKPVAPAVTAPGPAVAKAFARVVSVIDPQGGEGEPSLGVTPDGILFTNGLDHSTAAAGRDPGAVFRSKDGGATWEKIGAPTSPFPNFDPDLAVDKDGTVWDDNLWLGCTTTAVSKDQGKSWNQNPLACVPPAGDRQYIIPTTKGTAFIYSHNLPTFYQMGAKTTDYGATWVPLGPVEGSPDHMLLVNGGSGWGGGGFWNEVKKSVYFTFTYFAQSSPVDAGTWAPAYAVSHDDGASWTLGSAKTAGGGAVGLSLVVGAADAAGTSYLAWAESKDKDMAVYFSSSKDDGKTWSPPARVSDGNHSVVFPAITAGPAGKIAIAYYEADRKGYPSSIDKAAKWNVTLAYSADADGATPHFQYGQLSNQSVRSGPICPDGSSCTANRQFLDYFALKTMPDGRVASVFTSTEAVKGKIVNVFAASDLPVLS